jgi:hypothetical protein
MPAPKNPNTEAACAAPAVRRETEKLERAIAAAKLLLYSESYLVLSRAEVESHPRLGPHFAAGYFDGEQET